MEWAPVFSSHVDAIKYDTATQELRVRWQAGRESIYHGVPPEVGADQFKATLVDVGPLATKLMTCPGGVIAVPPLPPPDRAAKTTVPPE